MSFGFSLHIGLNEVSREHYSGWGGPLAACEADARDMERICANNGFETRSLLSREATRGAIVTALADAAKRLHAGDTLVVSFSGHGGQVRDADQDEPEDKFDETWCLYDGQMLDDEILAALAHFRRGVSVVVFSDSCHSGSIVRARADARCMPPSVAAATYAANRAFYDSLKADSVTRAQKSLKATILQISACQDDQLAGEGPENGIFTGMLCQVWSNGEARLSYKALFDSIRDAMPRGQTPNLLAMGVDTEALLQRRAFESGAAPAPGGHVALTPTSIAPEPAWSMISPVISAEIAAASFRLAQQLPVVGPDLYSANFTTQVSANRGGTVVRTFWWGLQVEVSHADLQVFLASANPVNAVIGSIGTAIPSPAAPYIALIAGFIAGALALLQGLDQGSGVYINMSWFAPGAFFPSTVPVGRGADLGPLATSRGPGQIVPLASGQLNFGSNARVDQFIDCHLPGGSVRDGEAMVYAAPGSNGACNFIRWYNPNDPRDGRFWLHIGSPFIVGGGTCVWIVSGHYEVYDPFPRGEPARAARSPLARLQPAPTSVANGV